jgi:hypothetical protein
MRLSKDSLKFAKLATDLSTLIKVLRDDVFPIADTCLQRELFEAQNP